MYQCVEKRLPYCYIFTSDYFRRGEKFSKGNKRKQMLLRGEGQEQMPPPPLLTIWYLFTPLETLSTCTKCTIHTDVPDTVLMESSEDLGELSGLIQLELSFSYVFSNVLCVHIKLYQLQGDKTSKVNIEYDKGFLVSVFRLLLSFQSIVSQRML